MDKIPGYQPDNHVLYSLVGSFVNWGCQVTSKVSLQLYRFVLFVDLQPSINVNGNYNNVNGN